MGFLGRAIARTVISTVVSAAVTLAVKEIAERRLARKQPVRRLTDQRDRHSDRRPAQRAKAPAE